MVIRALVRMAAEMLDDNARFEAEEIAMHALGLTRTQLVTDGGREVTRDGAERVLELARMRAKGEPLWYILGECEFMSLMFYAERGVLIPRQDTETLVEAVIARAENGAEILDICSGTGCIGISLAHYIASSRVTLIDISERAVRLSEKNAARNGVSERVKAVRADIMNEYPDGKFDIIVSNPPYIETAVIDTLQTEVKDHEPRLALDGGEDGLKFYRRITRIAPCMLKRDGILAFEIGYNQGAAVSEIMSGDFDGVEVIKDLTGNDRVVIGRKKSEK